MVEYILVGVSVEYICVNVAVEVSFEIEVVIDIVDKLARMFDIAM